MTSPARTAGEPHTVRARRVDGEPSLVFTEFDLAPLGYLREEWFVSGTARSYRSRHQGPDGHWDTTAAEEADFTTRIVVVRPVEPATFSGTVVVEWLNVSGGRDAAPDWLYLHREIVRRGSAWVGVTAQRAGVDGGGLREDQHLRVADPDRYRSLEHPGDAFAFDIFGQVARLARRPNRSGPMGALDPRTVLAIGDSQAAIFLTTYLNAVDAHDEVVDGVLLHGRSARGAWLDGTLWDWRRLALESVLRPALSGHRIRSDARVPVLTVQSETDLVVMGSRFARQPDSDRFRLWEVAGTSHFDMYGLRAGYRDDGTMSAADLHDALRPVTSPRGYTTRGPVNSGPQQHYVLQAGLRALESWVHGGPPPTGSPRLATRTAQPLRFVRDREGLVAGGVRSPFVEAPTDVLSGLGQLTGGFGMLFGSTRRLDPSVLRRRYPGGRRQYLEEFRVAVQGCRSLGHLLDDDVEEVIALGTLRWPDP